MKYRKEYESLFEHSVQIHQFLENINNSNLYTSRLSRIDVAIDLINEKVNVNTIYNQLAKENQIVKTGSGRKNHSILSAITKDNITSTFYLGSKGKNIRVLLRVYDKKKEQIETLGVRYDEAIHYETWARFEAVFKSTYAHDLSNELKQIKSDTELKDLLVSDLLIDINFTMPSLTD